MIKEALDLRENRDIIIGLVAFEFTETMKFNGLEVRTPLLKLVEYGDILDIQEAEDGNIHAFLLVIKPYESSKSDQRAIAKELVENYYTTLFKGAKLLDSMFLYSNQDGLTLEEVNKIKKYFSAKSNEVEPGLTIIG